MYMLICKVAHKIFNYRAEVASLQSKLKSYREQQCADRSRRLKLKTMGTEGQGAGWEVARGLEVQLQVRSCLYP